VTITRENLSDLPSSCRSCAYWELDAVAERRAGERGATDVAKQDWVSDTLLEWGSCGLITYVDGVAAGYVLYAPAAYVPRSAAFATSPVSSDAVLLMTARLQPAFRGAGLGRMLVQGVARDVARRRLRAIEAFGRRGGSPAHSDLPDVAVPGSGGEDGLHCLLPVDYLLAVGFRTVRAHARTPRLRLDIKSTVTWRSDVESALDRLVSSLHTPAVLRR
jgi:GNAT superfamily N-acetyltransferase